VSLGKTPSQTVGPYYEIGLCRSEDRHLVEPGTDGALELSGQLRDGDGAPVSDGMIEAWDAVGGRWGRSGTDADGRFSLVVVKPESNGAEAPRLDVYVFARGLLRHQLTRVYFPGEPANDADPVLSELPEDERATLVAVADGDALRFDVHLQGPDETVFFAH
jgi:protocatechuate 3,4-dioxygenase alpha subunit